MMNARAVVFSFALAIGAAAAYAQQTDATVSGTVSDPSGAHVIAARPWRVAQRVRP